jgi:hypothetical protein
MKSQRPSPLKQGAIMLKLAKHAGAIVIVAAAAAAAGAPVAAHADTPSFSYTHLAVTYTTQEGDGSIAQPR